jgi:tRNA threonylcarbamoyladenosine biosynthesis protein TsaE
VHLRALPPAKNRATVVAISGELGAGKTTFVRGVFRGLGITRRAVSPTFILVRTIRLSRRAHAFRTLHHVDAYRIDDPQELARVGFGELLADSMALMLIEWPERIQSLLPPPRIRVRLGHGLTPSMRAISIHG